LPILCFLVVHGTYSLIEIKCTTKIFLGLKTLAWASRYLSGLPEAARVEGEITQQVGTEEWMVQQQEAAAEPAAERVAIAAVDPSALPPPLVWPSSLMVPEKVQEAVAAPVAQDFVVDVDESPQPERVMAKRLGEALVT
jgi:hypothetical protein